MEQPGLLRYFYIGKHRGLEDASFNLDPKVRFELRKEEIADETRYTLEIKEREWYGFEDFFGEKVKNVNAIIGDNGVGKTSVFEFLMTMMLNRHEKVILVLGSRVFFNLSSGDNGLNHLVIKGGSGVFEVLSIHDEKHFNDFFKFPRSSLGIYMSNNLQERRFVPLIINKVPEGEQLWWWNISAGYMFRSRERERDRLIASKEYRSHGDFQSLLDQYSLLVLKENLSFIDYCKEHSLKLPFAPDALDKVQVRFIGNSKRIIDETYLSKHSNVWEIVQIHALVETAYREGFKTVSSDLAHRIHSSIFLMFILDQFATYGTEIGISLSELEEISVDELRKWRYYLNDIEENAEFGNAILRGIEEDFGFIINEKVWEEGNKSTRVLPEPGRVLVRVLKSLGEGDNDRLFIDKLISYWQSIAYDDFGFVDAKVDEGVSRIQGIPGEYCNRLILKTKCQNLSGLIELLQSESNLPFDLEFGWGMSAGELSFLNTLSRLHAFLKKGFSDVPHLILFMDEPDLHFHPEWQGNLVDYLVHYIGKMLGEAQTCQILFTTHSPLSVRDLPKEHVIFMRKGDSRIQVNDWEIETQLAEEKGHELQTFGTDLLSLYKIGFGTQDVFFSKFARRKLNEVFKKALDNESVSKEERAAMNKFADMVGDRVLRESLKRLATSANGN